MPQTESTGNPMRDLELQRMATARRFDREDHPHSTDEYAGLMSQRERQWIINIQLSQLKCENPFLASFILSYFDNSTFRYYLKQLNSSYIILQSLLGCLNGF